MSILKIEIPKTEELLKKLKKIGYRVRLRHVRVEKSPFKKNQIRIIKIRKKSFFGIVKGDVCLVIFIKFIHKDKVFWKVGEKTMAAPRRFYQNYKTIPFQDINLSIPKDTDGYLTHKYGDWNIPAKN